MALQVETRSAHPWLAKLPAAATQCLQRLSSLPINILQQQVGIVRQHLAVKPAEQTLKRTAQAVHCENTDPLPAKRAKPDVTILPDQSASALSCHSSPTAETPLQTPSAAERKSLHNRLVVLKAAIALKAVCEIQQGTTPRASPTSVLQQRLSMLMAERQHLKDMLLSFEERYNDACQSQRFMLTVEAHHEWEQRYREYDQLKQLLADTQAELAKCPNNNGSLVPAATPATDPSDYSPTRPCAVSSAPKSVVAHPRAILATALPTSSS
eukprot:m.72946 g.72946  ORF g.72946 m.72946 type:complete len:268 (-) comp14295_c0_seq1:1195-1998(-)